MIGHPREELLLAFQDHRLDDRGRRRLAGHLSGCQRCRNVVQAHRTVRGVFALEAPFAPDGVLARALASRAAGTIVLLPVAEPDARRRIEWPSRGFLMAAGVVLMFGVAVQVLPLGQFVQVFGAVGAVAEQLFTFDEPGRGLLKYPDPPVARGAVVDPARMRPTLARYRITRAIGSDRERRSRMEVTVSREPAGWSVRTVEQRLPSSLPMYKTSALLSDSLELREWEVISFTGDSGRHRHERRARLTRDSLYESYRYVPDSGGVQPPGREPYDSVYPAVRKRGGPVALGDGHFFVLLGTARLGRGWVGSITDAGWSTDRSLFQRVPTTLLAVGSDTVATPAGTYVVWELHELEIQPGGWTRRIWVDKASGLVIKERYGSRAYHSETVLESVTFP